jgi:hypothetical protein
MTTSLLKQCRDALAEIRRAQGPLSCVDVDKIISAIDAELDRTETEAEARRRVEQTEEAVFFRSIFQPNKRWKR